MKNRFFYLISMLLVVCSCTSNLLDIDVSEVNLEIPHINLINEFEKAQNISDLEAINIELNDKAPDLYEYYTAEMLRVGLPMQDSTVTFLNHFLEDSVMQLVNSDIKRKFDDFTDELKLITDMFKHLKYHIPNAILPQKLLTYNSTFSNGVISTPDCIGLGLEMYLGKGNSIVEKIPYPEYFKAKMNTDFLMPDIAQSWLESNVIEGVSEESFIANLMFYGKVLYTTKSMIPQLPDYIILRYYENELEWAKENEYAVWQYIVQQNLIYDTKMKNMLRYFKPAPSTIGFEGSPDRLGQFIGYQIVTSYMTKNPEVTIKQLIAEKNNTKILKSYKPKQ